MVYFVWLADSGRQNRLKKFYEIIEPFSITGHCQLLFVNENLTYDRTRQAQNLNPAAVCRHMSVGQASVRHLKLGLNKV